MTSAIQPLNAEGRLSAVFLFALWHLYRRARRDATALLLKLLSILGTTSSSIRMADVRAGKNSCAAMSITQINLNVNIFVLRLLQAVTALIFG